MMNYYYYFYQVATYIQVLWEDVNNDHVDLMNGAVESLYTLCGKYNMCLIPTVVGKSININTYTHRQPK